MAASLRRSAFNHIVALGALAGVAALGSPADGAPRKAPPPNDLQTCINASGDTAIAACTRAIESGNFRARNLASLYAMRGAELSNQGQHDRALADYDQAIRLEPNRASIYTGRGNVYRAKGDGHRAIADFDQAIRLDPEFAVAYYGRGNAYAAKGDIDAAIAGYDRAIRLDRQFTLAYGNRGNAYQAKGDSARAIADFDQAIRLNPEYAFLYSNRGLSYLRIGQLDRAVADFDAALKRDSKQPYSLYGRGIARLSKGDDRGHSDIAAAKALRSDIAELFARAGMAAPGSAATAIPPARSEAASAASPAPLPAPKLQPAPLPPVALAQASVKAVFEKHNLLGIFAWDCGRAASKDNLYYVNRLLDGDRVQRDQMSGPTTRDFVIFIDKAAEVSSNQVAVSGMREGKPTDIIWRIERAGGGGMRVRGVEASWDGQKLISGEKVSGSGREVPWLNRCGG